MIKKAKRRILISALYIGTEQGELVGELVKSFLTVLDSSRRNCRSLTYPDHSLT